MPTQIYLIGPENIKGTITGSVTGTSFKAKFPAIAEIGIYMFIVGFNDGSGADAYGFEVT